jgi:BlaI family penicillinase repressor
MLIAQVCKLMFEGGAVFMLSGSGDDDRKKPTLSEAEWDLMTVLWAEGCPLTSTFIMDHLTGRAWPLSNVMTMLARLCRKGFVHCDRSTTTNYYTATISGEEYREWEGRRFLKKAFGNSIANMVTALTKSGALNEQDIIELRKVLDQEDQ